MDAFEASDLEIVVGPFFSKTNEEGVREFGPDDTEPIVIERNSAQLVCRAEEREEEALCFTA